MIRIGFLLNFPLEYKGGINYIKNLFFALHKYYSRDIELVLFVPERISNDYIELFQPTATVIETKLLRRRSISWFISRIGQRLLQLDPLTSIMLRRHKIRVVSHSNYVYPGKKIPSINWIPDFQYLHFPGLWTQRQLSAEHRLHKQWVEKSMLIVLSSHNALEDMLTVYPHAASKARVLHFVSQPGALDQEKEPGAASPEERYFYLPNQFWEHKNHLVVFKAIKLLVDRKLPVRLVTSGLMHDFRSKDRYVSSLIEYVDINRLADYISFLGLISYPQVLDLMEASIAVINPSLFEGWSSTVEEAKSFGKKIILSDIAVHREQCPARGYYFSPDDPSALADIMSEMIRADDRESDPSKEQLALDLECRTKKFASTYMEIIHDALR